MFERSKFRSVKPFQRFHESRRELMNELLERLEYAMRRGRRPHGTVRLYKRGKLLWKRDDLFVNAGLTVLASLISGVTPGAVAAADSVRSVGRAAALSA